MVGISLTECEDVGRSAAEASSSSDSSSSSSSDEDSSSSEVSFSDSTASSRSRRVSVLITGVGLGGVTCLGGEGCSAFFTGTGLSVVFGGEEVFGWTG